MLSRLSKVNMMIFLGQGIGADEGGVAFAAVHAICMSSVLSPTFICWLHNGHVAVVCAGYSGCKQVRQVLVARPGQKPCAWVSFDSLRQNLLSWQGYALMAACWRQDPLVLPNSTAQGQVYNSI